MRYNRNIETNCKIFEIEKDNVAVAVPVPIVSSTRTSRHVIATQVFKREFPRPLESTPIDKTKRYLLKTRSERQ